MRLYGTENNEIILRELGHRCADIRLAMFLTQEDLATRAGVSLRTVERIEKGGNVNTDKLLNVLRVLQCLHALDSLIPEQELSPADIFLERKKRKRVSAKTRAHAKTTWKWGDEE